MLIPLTQSLPQSLALLLRASMKEIEARHVLRSRLPVGGQSAPLASLSGANFVEHVDENLGWRYSLVTLEGLRPGHRAAGRFAFQQSYVARDIGAHTMYRVWATYELERSHRLAPP